MSGENKRNATPPWLAWPAICLLCLLWALGALTGFVLGGMGKGGHWLADWALDAIERIGGE